MAFPFVLNAFTTGEVDPDMWARTDIEGYERGAAQLYNTFVDFHGGAVNRAGTQFIGIDESDFPGYASAQGDYYPRLLPFVYDEEQSLVMIFGDFTVRFMSREGLVVEDAKTITDVTEANPGVVTSVAHGYLNNQLVYFNSFVGGMTELNGRYFFIANKTDDTYQLRDVFTGVILSTASFTPYSSGGQSFRVYTLTSPYALEHVWSLKIAQARDVVKITSNYYPPYNLTRVSNTNWSFAVINFASKTAKPTGLSLNASMTGSGTEYSYVVTATDEATGEESEASAEVDVTTGYWTAEDTIKVDWNAVTGAAFYTVYRASVAKGRNVPASAIYGQVGQSRGTSYNDVYGTPNWALTPPKDRNPFDSANKYPATVSFVQQRAAYAGILATPYRVWMSPSGAFDSLNRSLPARDDDSLDFEIASQRADPIYSSTAMPAGLLLLTSGGIYHAYGGGDGEPLTPSNINIDRVTSIGASFLDPIVVDLNVLYCQFKGSLIRNLIYNFSVALYESVDLTYFSSHLFHHHTIVRWAYSNEPWKIVWAVRNDGRLISMTYFPEQKVYAMALHETQGFVLDVCSIPEQDEDFLYLAIWRPEVGRICLERMSSRKVKTICDCWFVDSGQISVENWQASPVQAALVSGTTYTITALSGTPFASATTDMIIRGGGSSKLEIVSVDSATQVTVNAIKPITDLYPDGTPRPWGPNTWLMDPNFTVFQGLYHLEGQEVVGLADGFVVGPLTVTNGTVTLPFAASRVILGLPYTSRVKTLPIEFETGDTMTIQTRRKNFPQGVLRLTDSRAVGIGPDFDHLETWASREDEPLGTPPSLVTGDRRVVLDGGWSEEGQICIEQSNPLPMHIVGLIPDVDVGDGPWKSSRGIYEG